MKANYNTEITAAKIEVQIAQVAFDSKPSQKTAKVLTEKKIILEDFISRPTGDENKELARLLRDSYNDSKLD